jgi:hypothetical protein
MPHGGSPSPGSPPSDDAALAHQVHALCNEIRVDFGCFAEVQVASQLHCLACDLSRRRFGRRTGD